MCSYFLQSNRTHGKLVSSFVPNFANCISSAVMDRRINRILALFFISLITALPGSNGDEISKDETSFDSLTVTQDVTSGIEEINELARQMKDNADHEDEEIRTLSMQLHTQTESLFSLVSGPMSELLKQAAKNLDAAKNCQELANLGMTDSGTYRLDPDGQDRGAGPISVRCDFSDNSTEIVHDQSSEIIFDGKCQSLGCEVVSLDYQVPESQIKALMNSSEECQQSIRFDCFLAPLTAFKKHDNGYWSSFDSTRHTFFHGFRDEVSPHFCQCGINGTCVEPMLDCNCDANLPTWQTDEGVIEDTDVLPITEFGYGPLEYELQEAKVSIGSLKCFGTTTVCNTEGSQSISAPPEILFDDCNLATLETTNRLKINLEYISNQDCDVVLSLPEEKEMKVQIHDFNVSNVLLYTTTTTF